MGKHVNYKARFYVTGLSLLQTPNSLIHIHETICHRIMCSEEKPKRTTIGKRVNAERARTGQNTVLLETNTWVLGKVLGTRWETKHARSSVGLMW